MPDVVTALDQLRAGRVDFAVVPIENSVEGGVSATLDTLAVGDHVCIVGEVLVPVTFVLAAPAGVELKDVRRVGTHTHAHAQCRRWLVENLPDAAYVPTSSTAAAAAGLASESGAPYDAGIFSPLAAELYGLTVLADAIEDNSDAVTRFVVVGQPGPPMPVTGADKTTLVIHLPTNQPGALLEMLEQFAARGVNLSRIESRPVGDTLGRYSFSVDAEAHLDEERMREVLIGLHRICPQVRYLGSYPRADGGAPHAIRPGTADSDFESARAWVESLGR